MLSPKLYISSGHLRTDPDDLHACVLRAKESGFDGLEILGPAITGGCLSDDHAKNRLAQVAQEQSILLSFHAWFNWENEPYETLRCRMEQLVRDVHMCGGLDINLHLDFLSTPDRGGCGRIIQLCQDITTPLKQYGIRIYFENTPNGPHDCLGNKPDDFIRILTAVDPSCFGFNLDVGHALIGCMPDDYLRPLSPYLGYLHLHDNDGITDLHMVPGAGKADWVELFAWLDRIDFAGILMYEFNERHLDECRRTLLPLYHQYGYVCNLPE